MTLIRDGAWGFLLQIFTAAVQFAAGVWIARMLGTDGRGIYGLLVLIPMTVQILGVFGQGTAGMRQATRAPEQSAAALATVLAFTSISGVALALALWALGGPVSHFVGIDGDSWLLPVAALACWVLILDQTVQSVLNGLGRVVRAQAIKLCQAVCFLVLLAIAFLGGSDPLLGTYLAWLGANVFSLVLSLVVAVAAAQGTFKPSWPLMRQFLHFGRRYLPTTLASFLLMRSDLYLVRAYCPIEQVGIYGQAASLAMLFQFAARAMERALAPRLMAAAGRQKESLAPVAARCFVFLFTPFFVVGTLVAQPLVPLVFGADFTPSAQLLAPLLAGILLGNVGIIVNAELLGLGKPEYGSRAALVGLAINVGLNLVLIPRFGIWGAAVSSLAAYALYGVSLAWIYARTTGLSLSALFILRRGDLRAMRGIR